MQLFPAIDLRDGQVVRLTQGDYDQMEIYSSNPTQIAKNFQAAGANNLHVVDLDGARDGQLANFSTIRDITQQTDLFVQVGGGIRDQQRIEAYLDAGVDRVILGTVAAENPNFVSQMVDRFGKAIAVGVDARDGKVAVKGWQELTELDSMTFCKEMEQRGVSTIIYTDISRDGMMEGTNLSIYKKLTDALSLDIVASGGVTHLEELSALKLLSLYGVIIGKALYTGHIELKEALALCR